MPKFKITPHSQLGGVLSPSEVDGEPVTIPGFEEYKFFTHASVNPTRDKGAIAITEENTNACIGCGKDDGEALRNATERLSQIGKPEFVGAIAIFVDIMRNG